MRIAAMFPVSIALIGCILGILTVSQGETSLTSFTPNYGSLAGGTRLVIYGAGFGDMYTSTVLVYVGPYPCTLIMHYTTSEVLTCETSPGLAGTYFVYVSVDGAQPESIYGYTYSDYYTPTLKTIVPRAGPPGARVTLRGDTTYNLRDRDCVENTWGETNCLGSIIFGDYLCRVDPTDSTSGISFVYNDPRYGYQQYLINCTLPAPEVNNDQPALGTAGKYNATIHFEASMRGASPTYLRSSYLYDVNGTAYHFQVYPEVSSITPSIGSTAGGTLVKVTGRGFVDLSLGLGGDVAIMIGGAPCAVVNSTFDTVFCVTGAQPSTPPSSSVPIRGHYPAMRGVEYEFYNTTTTGTPEFSGFWQLNKTIFTNNTVGTGSYKQVLYDIMESREYMAGYHCTRMKAFFLAPRTGFYRFYTTADDYAQLNATWLQDGIEMTRSLINQTSWTSYDSYFMYDSQKSPAINFTAGQPVLLETAHCNTYSYGMVQVAARMPVDKPQINSMSEMQSVVVSSTLLPNSFAIKYLSGAGANTTAFTVTVVATNNSRLDEPLLGLELVFNSGSPVVVLPVTATGPEMTRRIELGFANASILGSANNSFGVLKMRSTGVLTVQIGIDSALASSLGFDVSLARMVNLPPAPAFTPTPCNISGVTSVPPVVATSPVPDLAADMYVILEATRPVPAANPSEYFKLSLATSTVPLVMSHDTNATVMASAIKNLTGYDVGVQLITKRREGAYFARVWNVTFPLSSFNNAPMVIAELVDSMPVGELIATESRPATPPITGTLKLSFGDICGAVSFDVTASEDTVRTKLAALPGMVAPLSVDVSGGPAYGYTFIITFDPIGNPGDQPELRVADTSGLMGVMPKVSITTIRNGSTDAFYGPITAEFLQLAVPQPGSIALSVNGVPGACVHPSGVCGFTYSTAVTPTVTSVSPTSLSFNSTSSLPLTITGTLFNASSNVTVKVGGAACNITSLTATQIVCLVPETAPAGIRLVTVHVDGLGYAAGAKKVTLETLYVTGTAPSPAVAATVGMTLLNITGKGFDNINCNNNKLFIGSAQCGVVACGVHYLRVIYPGSQGGDVPAASIKALVYEGDMLIDQDTPTTPTAQISMSAPAIQGISPSNLPGSGGLVSVTLSGVTASSVTSVFMVPQITSLTDYTAAAASYTGRVSCKAVASINSGSGVSCSTGALPNGRYHVLVVLSTGVELLSSDTVLFDLVISGVSPALGSIGGGTTVTITGAGFSLVALENVVFIPIPVSSTFINGIIECDILAVNTSHLTCVTQAHMAADRDVDDPNALKVMPIATDPHPITVAICDLSYNTTVLRGYCASTSSTPLARCAPAASCSFGYSTALTPFVEDVDPGYGYARTNITVSGQYMDDITTVHFTLNDVAQGQCTVDFAWSTGVTCIVPDLPAGVYNLLLEKANGELSVDPYKFGVFTYHATILGLVGNVGSLSGGLPLSITVGGAGLAVGADNATSNIVTIAGLRCPVISVSDRTQLTCRAPTIYGYVYAEYWNLGASTYSMPDLISFTDPVVARLERGVNFDWASSSPSPGTIQLDFFAARFTFYYQLAQLENVTFKIDSDDGARLYVDDLLLGSQGTYLSIILAPGVHKIVVTYVEYSGYAAVRLNIGTTPTNGTLSSMTLVEWQKVTPVAPGAALPVELMVSGVSSKKLCLQTTVQLQLQDQPTLSFEPSELTIRSCAYVFSTHRTPALMSVRPYASSGITQPSFAAPLSGMLVYGNFLLNQSLPAADQITVEVANRTCVITEISPYTYSTNVSSTATTIVNGTTVNTTVINTTSINMTRINCSAPPLPVGVWPVNIMVAGLGLTRPTASATTDLPLVTYTVRVNSYLSPPLSVNTGKCQLSVFGGGTFNFTGYGFVKDLVDTDLRRNMSAAWEATSPCGSGASTTSPTCLAAQSNRLNLTAVACDGPTVLFQLTRFAVPNPSAYAGNNSVTNYLMRYKPHIYYMYTNNPQFEVTSSAQELYFCGGRTPALSNVSPSSVAPDSGAGGGATLALTWMLSGVGSNNNTITKTEVGAISNARVDFEVGPTVLACANVTVAASAIMATNYTESITCKLPTYLPAANYTLWLCIQPFGCGLMPAYPVPLTVSSISTNVGSSAGGIAVTVTGKGFDTNSSLVAVRFGNSTCKVTNSSASSVTCITGALDTKPDSPVTWALSVTPTVGASETTYPALTFTFDPSLESMVASISPARGSTEGGTPVTITGASFMTGVSTKVTIGDTPCTSVMVVNTTTITCTTGKPPTSVLRIPLPVAVMQEGRGLARSSGSYQYIDVWSRNSTWGGGPLPGYEDTVVIPAGVTVLLDISPPKLFFIVLEGNLEFDDTQPYINLQAHYIIVKGGNFSIGSADKPFPGRANITMHGAPNSRDLPMYGAKSLGVRRGVVSFHGLPKIPHYAKLNQSADIGSTSITVNGAVNWEVGDRIVIASSSFYPEENDEVTIRGLDNTTSPGCTVISIDAPLKYTHLGEIHSQAGVATPLDMRAEVAVLTRNVVLMGDWTSAKNMYGVQVMVNTPAGQPKGLVRFDNIEITQSGQAFRLGRYSMHWHLMGDLAYQSWVRGCAIHHTYNRAITVHGTHRSIIQNTIAYNTMGHTFFMEDGVETSNLMEGNIAIYAKRSDALLNTDVTPGAFWITNPNNTLRNNVAVGSLAYGFWYRMLDYPDGPSATTTVCPKFTPLQEFTNNSAHSNQFYGLRIHPEFYPRNVPCNGFSGTFEQVPAVFNGFVAYKNGVKGAVASQVGLVQFTNMVAGDNGGGPKEHVISGKDNGASLEVTWVVDNRNRYDVKLTEMSGIHNATIYARTTVGQRGSAGQWPSGRRITAVIAQSPVKGHFMHSALMSLINVTIVGFTASGMANGFSALEHCGHCKAYQGGATTFTANISFVNPDNSYPALSFWSWGHQGIFLDTDGTLLNPVTLPSGLLPSETEGWMLGPGATWHSAVSSELFDPTECVYVRNTTTSNDGAICSPALNFRRVMLNQHGPTSIITKNLKLVSLTTNRTSIVHESHYNEDGYQFTAATGRDYWIHWDMAFRFDPEYFTLHKMDPMNSSDYLYLTTKYIQRKDHFRVNSLISNRTAVPPSTSLHGDFSYNKTFDPNTWMWSNRTYNDTKMTILLSGPKDGSLSVASYTCPDTGCSDIPDTIVDIRNGTLYWSDPSTWNTSITNYTFPAEGNNVTIPFGWDLVIDMNPPALQMLVIQGSVRFDPTRDVNLTASYIIVMNQGSLRAGTPDEPHPTNVTILLTGQRDTPDYAITNTLVFGSKVLAAIGGGTIDLFGRQVNKSWVRLGARASPGDTSITVSDSAHGWRVGDKIIISSTSYNVWQSEIRTIRGFGSGAQLLLDAPLNNSHGALIKAYANGPTVDMRAEVGLLTSNILITTADGASTHSYNGERFGARVLVFGNSTGRFSGIAMQYCGQAGFENRACILFDHLTSVRSVDTNTSAEVLTANPSMLYRSALVYGMGANVIVDGVATSDPVAIIENVMYESHDTHGVEVYTRNNIIESNLVLGTIKDMSGKAVDDLQMPSSFYLVESKNWVQGNVAGGSERYGFTYHGVPCNSSWMQGYFRNNTAHSCLAGMWLRSSNESSADTCTAVRNFTTYMNWDFGIISTRGIQTDVYLDQVNILDTKHSGIAILRKANLTEKANVWWSGGVLAGQSSNDVCSACASLQDAGCHNKLSNQSYNRKEPFTPAVGLQSAQFTLSFPDGPERKPWDKPKGYSVVHGMFNITGVTLADFYGPAGCGGAGIGTYALANHPLQPETFYPHFFSRMNVINVADGPGQGMFYHTPPDPDWRSESACGDATYTRADGTVIPLNCAGPAHLYWRDLDGTLTGTKGTIAGLFRDTPRVFPMDQGTPLLPGPCTYSRDLDAYSCVAGSDNFLLDPRMKPNPIPADGIFGDPQYFVLESRDKDSEDRNFGPVFFNISGSIDLVIVQADHGCCFTYKCQKRLSNFATYLPTGQTVYINFTGTPAQIMRYWLPYADPDKEIVLVINMLYNMNRRFVYLPRTDSAQQKYGRMTPEAQPVRIGDGTGHAAYYWDQANTLLYVKMKGGGVLESRTENAVYVTQSFALTIDQFYDIQEIFLKSLAYAMNISQDRIFIAKIVAGSTTVTTAISPEAKDEPELTLNEGSDRASGDPLPDPPAPEPPVVLTQSDMDHIAAMGSNAPNISELTWANLLLLRELWALFDTYVQTVETAASEANIQTLGPASSYISVNGLQQSPPPPLNLPSPLPSPTSSTPPASAPSVNPSPPISGNPNSGPDSAGYQGKPSSTPAHERKEGLAGGAVAGIVIGALVACVFVGVAVYVVVIRRHAKRTRPVSPPGEPEESALANPNSPKRASLSSGREALSPAAQAVTERRGSATVDIEADRGFLGSPRRSSASGSLAAGYMSPSSPQPIRPLTTTNKQPHSSQPLVLPVAPLSPPAADPGRQYASGSNIVTKAPAELQRSNSLSRNSAPHDLGTVGMSEAAATQAVTDGDFVGGYFVWPGSGNRVQPTLGAEPERPGSRSAAPAAPIGDVAEDPILEQDGETPVVPVQRTLETMESFIPRPKSRSPGGSRPGSADAPLIVGHHGSMPDGVGDDLSGTPSHAVMTEGPAVQLPGGVATFEASLSLIRSEAAAQIYAGAGSSAEGFGGAADTVMQDEQTGSPRAARTPADLRSDSMVRRGGLLQE